MWFSINEVISECFRDQSSGEGNEAQSKSVFVHDKESKSVIKVRECHVNVGSVCVSECVSECVCA
jgi:hypothetical protein